MYDDAFFGLREWGNVRIVGDFVFASIYPWIFVAVCYICVLVFGILLVRNAMEHELLVARPSHVKSSTTSPVKRFTLSLVSLIVLSQLVFLLPGSALQDGQMGWRFLGPNIGLAASVVYDPDYQPDLGRSRKLAHQLSKNHTVSGAKRNEPRTVVVVQNESLFCDSDIRPKKTEGGAADETEHSALPIFSCSDSYKRLGVSVFGGNSWATAFEVITGMDVDWFGPAGRYSNYTLAPHAGDTIFGAYKRRGYEITVVYPMSKQRLNARQAYTGLGADRVVDPTDFGFEIPNDDRTSDRVVYDIIEAILSETDGRQFVFALTNATHAPYKSINSFDAAKTELEIYRDRAKRSADAIAKFSKTIQGFDSRTFFLFYGDHKPKLSAGYRRGTKFETFLGVQSNYEWPEPDWFRKAEKIDSVAIAPLLCRLVQCTTPLHTLSMSVARECKGRFDGCSSHLMEGYRDAAQMNFEE